MYCYQETFGRCVYGVAGQTKQGLVLHQDWFLPYWSLACPDKDSVTPNRQATAVLTTTSTPPEPQRRCAERQSCWAQPTH